MRIAVWLSCVLCVSALRAQRPVVLLTDAPDLRSTVQALDAVRASGIEVAVIPAPGAYIGRIRDDRAKSNAPQRLGRCLYGFTDEQAAPAHQRVAVGYLNALLQGRLDNSDVRRPMAWSTHPDHGHALERPEAARGLGEFTEDWACTEGYNSEQMTGTVVASTFLVESDGSTDANTYSWTTTAIQQVEQQVIDAWSIWSYTASLNGATVTAVMEWYEPSSGIPVQGYEPVTRPSSQDNLWIGAIMQHLGRTENNVFSQVDGFNHDRRQALDAARAVTAFIAYNPPDQGAPSQFSDGKIGYAYLGGPYMQLLYKANGWSTSQVNRVYGHELGHLFHAFDEYTSSGSFNCTRSFNGRQNLNFQGSSCGGSAACVMVDNSFSGSGATRRWNLCAHTPFHLGWTGTYALPTGQRPINDTVLTSVPVRLKWTRHTVPPSASCYVRVVERNTGATVFCGPGGVGDSLALSLVNGAYAWTASLGNPNDANGFAGVTSAEGLFTLNAPLQAAFTASNLAVCAGSAVTYTDHSTGAPNQWEWIFPGGTPSSFNGAVPPPVTYAAPGSYTVTLTVSDGVGSSVATLSPPISITGGAALPFTQNFNGGVFPPTGWTIAGEGPQGGDLDWTADVAAGCDPQTAARVSAYNHPGFASPVLLSPLIDLSATTMPYLRFRYSYARRTTTNTETFTVTANDCAYQVNTTLFTRTGTALATNGGTPVGGTPWQPMSCSDWREVVVRLDALRGRVGRIQFRLSTTGGQNLYLDDIAVFDGVRVPLRVMLEGPFDSTSHWMRDDLRALHWLPATEPYSSAGYGFLGEGGGEVLPAGADAITGADALVDWVVVEVREAAAPTHVIASRAALVQRDGDIMDVDGTGPVRLPVTAGNYHVAVRHRDHLGAMTATPLALANGMPLIDLSAPATPIWGTNARKIIAGTATLWAGDVTGDGALKYTGADNDRDPILLLIGGTVPTNTVQGYHGADVNMDGVVKYTGADNDRDRILLNIPGAPTNVRTQQLP
ncbi:MAG TPA: PKD domain-containing protein [Flavobacteriales bacterium]|nr:PKD domain-containing protein [Flavobacteriales bacterium]